MKVLTIKQPWATLIMQGNKRFEFRSWQTKYRGDLLIHAEFLEFLCGFHHLEILKFVFYCIKR